MKYLSLFSGIGGFELGIQQAYELQKMGIESEDSADSQGRAPQHTKRPLCIGFSEIDKYATQIYQHKFPDHKQYGDITKINTDELPDFDLLVGGFPCQAFSIAGKRKGFEDTRGTLFFEIARILRAKQPRLFLLENVKGLLSHDNGKTFRTIISTLDELGYDLQWQVLNSKNHGVPQNRERVFVVGNLRGTSRPQVFPFGESDGETKLMGARITNFSQREFKWRDEAPTLAARDYKDPKIVQLNSPTHSNDRVYGTDGVSPTLNTMQGGNRQPFIATRNDGMKVEMTEANSVTPDAYLTSGKRGLDESGKTKLTPMHERRIRRLTPTECERLQGFPDDFTKYGVDKQGQEVLISDTQRYKVLGNAVTISVIKDIMCQLLK